MLVVGWLVFCSAGSGLADVQPYQGPVVQIQDRPIATLRDLNQALIDIAAAVKPTVVTVSTERVFTVRSAGPFNSPFGGDPLYEFFFGPQQQPREREYLQRGLGSGVLVSEDGFILTNNHVVKDADSIFVRTYDNHRFIAEVIGVDPQTDIAVLKIKAGGLNHIEIGDSDDLQVGEMVLAIGSPMSENLAYTVTQGIVSATGRSNVGLAEYEDFIQTDAAINPGNSGGPLVNLNGELVGINSAIASRTGGFQGIGFAVPVNMALRVMTSLREEGRVVRGWLGVTIQDVSEAIADALGVDELSGALVGDVFADSPAEEAGFEPGDVIVSMDGKPVKDAAQLRISVASSAPGTLVRFDVLRGEGRLQLTVRLGELPAEFAQVPAREEAEELLGFAVNTLTRESADRYGIDDRLSGLVVTSIDQQSGAYRAGLRQGDLIRAINKERLETREQWLNIVGTLEKGNTVLLRVHREGGGFYIAFEL